MSDTTIRQVIAAGADDEVEIGRECGAGTGCGSCHEELRRLCDEARQFALSRAERSLVGASR